MALLIATLFALAGSGTGKAPSSCAFAAAPKPVTTRQSEPAPKGVVLYSWQTADDSYRYALLRGRNRGTPAKLITSEAYTLELEELKVAVAGLAIGEQVFWVPPRDCPSGLRCSYPPEPVAEEVRAIARHANVAVHGAP